SAAGFNALALKTLAFLALQLEATFPGTPILPTLGNNDSDCGDYGVTPGGPLLKGSLDSVARMIGKDARDHIAASWTALGNYSMQVAAEPGLTIVAFNSNYFSPHYRNACGRPGDGDPARATLAWLEAELARAAAAHRR